MKGKVIEEEVVGQKVTYHCFGNCLYRKMLVQCVGGGCVNIPDCSLSWILLGVTDEVSSVEVGFSLHIFFFWFWLVELSV